MVTVVHITAEAARGRAATRLLFACHCFLNIMAEQAVGGTMMHDSYMAEE